ncbi:crotonase/enoyl-CoA hydratase family protein [Nocardioides zeae]|uniref:Crotonase/enoyl-CoA hydratase family protein n=1 Tax=Nocardioides imazamoxiresistens TaxID=3231893 RepID=A0ABU3PVS1_9ACTN|nr:crotonase/enoyl-CoA hydratase family protein [Nocardioides zeae]MDT9593330.1 crotonase/enoyl-CoA hydratase family protein [Nocardioides zeae]
MVASPTTTHVSCTVEDGVAHVRLDRPSKLNALTLETLDDLIRTARWLRTDRTLRAVIISGEGDAFCAGLDFATVLRKPGNVARAFVPSPLRGTNTFQEACWAWRRVPVPVIAAVHGHCYGGGLQIALAADFRIATPDSKWSVLEGRWGLIPDMSGVRSLSELVGLDVAKKLTMTAEIVSGKEARDLGLVTDLDADPVAAAEALAASLTSRSPDAVAAAKRLFDGARTSSARRTFARERLEQLYLLAIRNTRVAREAAFAKVVPTFGPRSR